MKNKRPLILIPLIIVVAGVLIYTYVHSKSQREENVISVSGNIEVTDAEVSFKLAGRVEERLASEGETVEAGQIVALLDKSELVQEVALQQAEVEAAKSALAELEAGSRSEEIAQAEAAVEKAQARLDELLAGARPQEVAVAEATVQRAQAEAENLQVEYERHRRLRNESVTSQQEYDAAKTAYEMAKTRLQEAKEQLKLIKEGPRKEEIEQARAALKEAQEQYALVKAGPRKETIDQARARLQQTKEALALAETRLSYATLRSPLSGVVLSESIEPGEYVAPGTPVVTVGDLKNVWLRTYINETDLGRIKVGQRVRVTTDTYPDKHYEGRVSFIASQAEFTPKNVQTEKERVKLVYRVKVDIPNPNMELKPGMPADAEILLDQME
jgi:HlyD family secretion protein